MKQKHLLYNNQRNYRFSSMAVGLLKRIRMTKASLQDILEWDVCSWSQALHYWDTHINWNTIQHCLEVGARSGGLSLWLALKGKQVLCSDLYQATELAAPLHQRYTTGGRIRYEDLNAADIPYENTFDLIIFKSVLGGVGMNNNYTQQQHALRAMHRALKPGGVLLFAENLVASPLHIYVRRKFLSWGNAWRYMTVAELESNLSLFSRYELHTYGFCATFGRNEWQRRLLAGVDKLLFNPLLPKHWKYIGYGMAVK